MSRGLGIRQRLILQALLRLEQEDSQQGPKFYVWAVMKTAWDLGLRTEHENTMVRHREAADAWRRRLQVQADAGDTKAQRKLILEKILSRPLCAFRRSRGTRAGFGPVEYFNSSRTFALLKSRGLVERGNEHLGSSGGQGACISLTEKGRAAV